MAGTPTKITPAIAALLTDEHEAGASFRELERRHPGFSRARIAVHGTVFRVGLEGGSGLHQLLHVSAEKSSQAKSRKNERNAYFS